MKQKLHFQRFEFKYQLPREVADKIRFFLKKKMLLDPYLQLTGQEYYWVTSLYFDSPNMKSFYEKIHGAKARRKFRVRAYADQFDSVQEYFLEIKRKYDMTVVKDRMVFGVDDLDAFVTARLDHKNEVAKVDKKVWEEYVRAHTLFGLQPMVQVRYKREPFIGKRDSKIRITFDYDIESCLEQHRDFEDAYTPILDSEVVIMEVKFNNLLPAWFRDILYEYQLNREPYSKYCESVMHHRLVNDY